MKPARFELSAATDLASATTLLAQVPGAKLAAGNQSLGPMLNLRLARPERLVEVAGLEELRQVREEG